jgi:UDP-N-acetyl-2-amino-2-deoxyglucuronate dehydrogenase
MNIRVGLIGGGNISATHARATRALPGVEIAAVFGSNTGKVKALAAEYSATPYSDFDRFLAHRPMEMVAIGSPSGLHAEQGIAAAKRGLHVLVEKPIDITTERADALIAETDKAGVRLGVFFQDRFKPDLLRVKQWLDSGGLGKPHLIDARVKWHRPAEYYADSRWRGTRALDGGGALINQGIHTVDLMLWLAGDVKNVHARTKTALHNIETEDTVVALLEFESGAVGVLEAATSVYPGYPRRLEITGSAGTVIIEQDRVIAADLREGEFVVSGDAPDANPSSVSPVVSDVRGHQAAVEDFIHAIQNDTTPRCDGREGRRSLALVEKIYAAARSGGRQ